MSKQTHSFQAEVAQLLHLVTHSLYSNQEIFLRELISNASDACDKLRFEALNNAALYEDAPNLEVRVAFDKAAKTITITGAIVGVGSTQRASAVRWGVAGNIVWAWILTIPASAFVAAIAYWVSLQLY